jgi:DNA-binding Xre family transcriptional regulator
MIKWKFKSFLAEKHQIYSVTELQKRIVKRTGVAISLAHLCKLVNGRPSMLRLSTTEILCTALACELNDFLEVGPKAMNPDRPRKLSFKNTPKSKIGAKNFPSPTNYEE